MIHKGPHGHVYAKSISYILMKMKADMHITILLGSKTHKTWHQKNTRHNIYMVWSKWPMSMGKMRVLFICEFSNKVTTTIQQRFAYSLQFKTQTNDYL